MKRPAYTREELSKMTADEITAVASPQIRDAALKATNRVFDVKMKRRPDESAGDFLVRQRESTKVNKAEFPKLLRTKLEAEILGSPDNVNQAKADKMFAGWKMTDTEKAELAAHQEARARRDRQQDFENGRTFTAGPAVSTAQWDAAPAAAKPTQAPKPAANPTRPAPRRSGKSRN